MKIVAAGLGRSGTQSIVAALRELGVRTVAQEEVMPNPNLAIAIVAALKGERAMDWSLLEDAEATVGWPLCWLWREQLARWPEAICMLNVRDPNKWFDSVVAVWPAVSKLRHLGFLPRLRGASAMLSVAEERMGGPPDRRRWVAAYNAHVEAVKSAVPPERLFVYRVTQGWAPICAALDVPVPDRPFPRENSSASGAFTVKLRDVFGV